MHSPSALPIFFFVPAKIHAHMVNTISTHRSMIFSVIMLIGLIALVCCAAIGVVVYNKRKEKGKPDLSKEKDRKDGGK